ncbi:MAG: HlyD family efflux transporter periplasmic adaptor subunit, partial [Candidatus Eremiobacteraeota bacterium]|nr:HlyD family efflux transporter periplasmic adaptor subunit [Candidatus Eremiobacteraeota bacterium]
ITAVRDATADPAQPLVQVVDPAALEVRVLLTPADAARVHAGAPVTVTAGGSGAAEALGTGEVVAVGVAVDSLSGGVEARARVTRPTRALRMGEVVRVAIEAGARTDALVVPVAALVPSTAGDGYQVFVVTRGDTARVHPVTVGVRTDQVVQILRGVLLGDTVVSVGAYGVEDGVRVAPQHVPSQNAPPQRSHP